MTGPRLALLAGLLLAPAPLPAAERRLVVDGRTRTYRLHVPPVLPAGRPVPLVLVFHGGGGQSWGMERLSRFDPLADREGFLVAYPDGLGRHWNDGREPNREATRGVDDVRFVSALLDELEREYPVDARRVYATGMSNGAIFCNHLAIRLAGRLAAIAPVAGGLTPRDAAHAAPRQAVAVLMMNGTRDPLMPYGGGGVAGHRGEIVPTGDAVAYWLRADGIRGEPAAAPLPDADPRDGCTVRTFSWGGGEVVLYRIEGGGHTWPGGQAYLPRAIIGRVCRDFDATRAIWEFFRRHPKA